MKAIPQSDEYGRYADAHWRELIERYEPAVLWNDIGYPVAGGSPQLFADYYDAHPDGVVNNRFDFLGVAGGTAHADFTTPEYAQMDDITEAKWEACRGIGHSFGLNRNAPDDDLLSVDALVHLLVDIVSKNGNLLLNVGPAADGRIPHAQAERLLGPRLVAQGERRGHLRDAAVDVRGRVDDRGSRGAVHVVGRQRLRDRARPPAEPHLDDP